jgi:hypothetical protein
MAALVAAAFGAFVWTYFQAQGRYLYPALLPLSLLGAWGLRSAMPERFRETGSAIALAVAGAIAVLFLAGAVMPADA